MPEKSIDHHSTHSAARVCVALLLTVLLVFPDLALAQSECNSSSSNTSWTAFPSTFQLPNPIETLNAVVNNGYLYVVGGSTGTTGFQSTVSYVQLDTTTGLPASTFTSFQQTTALPVALSRDLCGVAYNGYLYTVGGVEAVGTNGTTVGNIQYAKFTHPVNGTIGAWTTEPGMLLQNGNTVPLPPVQLHGTVVLNGYMYIIGGSTGTNVTTSQVTGHITPNVYYAQVNSDGSVGTFTQTASLPIPLYKTCPVAIEGTIYMFGGETHCSPSPCDPAIDNVYYATPNTTGSQIGAISNWTEAPTPYNIPLNYFNTNDPSGLAAQAVVYVNTEGIVFMGGDTTGNGGDTHTALEATDPTDTNINWHNSPPPNLPANVSRNAGATLNHYAYSVAGLVAGNDSTGINCLLID